MRIGTSSSLDSVAGITHLKAAMTKRPKHIAECQIPICSRAPVRYVELDNGKLWVCGAHYSRWAKHRCFFGDKPISDSTRPLTDSSHPGTPTPANAAGRPGPSETARLTSEPENGQADANHADFSSKSMPLPAPSECVGNAESLSDDEIIARYGPNIACAVYAFNTDAHYAALIVERAKRLRRIAKADSAFGSI